MFLQKRKENIMKDKEELLLGKSLDDLIKMKIEQEFTDDIKKSKEKPKKKVYTNIKDLPKEKIFSKETVYKFFNRNTKCESYINGLQAEALIGTQNHIRSKMLNGELNAFTTENAYIKFEKAEF